MPKPSYTAPQMTMISRALGRYRKFAKGSPKDPLSWPEVATHIEERTDLEIQAFATNDPEARATNKRLVRNAGERLRQFVEGKYKTRPEEKRELENDLPYVVEFLTLDEIAMLRPEDLVDPEISLFPAAALADALWEIQVARGKGLPDGAYASLLAAEDVAFGLTLEVDPESATAAIAEHRFDPNTGLGIGLTHGWAVLTPEGEMLAFLKPALGPVMNRRLTLFFRPDEDHEIGSVLVREEAHAASVNAEAFACLEATLSGDATPKPPFTDLVDDLHALLPSGHGAFCGRVDEVEAYFDEKLEAARIIHYNKLNSFKFSREEAFGYGMDMKEDESSCSRPLIDAVVRDDALSLTRMIADGADINAREAGSMQTALHYAAGLGRRRALRALITCADLDFLVRDARGRLPSFLADLSGGDPAITRLLDIKETLQAAERGVDLPVISRPAPSPAPAPEI